MTKRLVEGKNESWMEVFSYKDTPAPPDRPPCAIIDGRLYWHVEPDWSEPEYKGVTVIENVCPACNEPFRYERPKP